MLYTIGNKICSSNGKSFSMASASSLPKRTLRFKFDDTSYDPSNDGNPGTWVRVSSEPNIWDVTRNTSNWNSLFYQKFSNITGYMYLIDANTTDVTSMEYTFAYLDHLRTVCLFDTSNVTNLRGTFLWCPSLLEIPALNTANVTTLYQFCSVCTSITTLPLLNTANVKYWQSAFKGMYALTSLPLFNTSSAVNISFAFSECYRVETGALALYNQMRTQARPPSIVGNAFLSCGSSTTSGQEELSQIPTSWGGTMQ